MHGTASSDTRRALSAGWDLPPDFVVRPDLSFGDSSSSALIQSDNLHALEALRRTHKGQIQCVYLDPPYNNREVYRHYRDDHSHEEWLGATVARLAAIKPLLSSSGSVWISIDDHAMHYLKVAADGVFGRGNFVSTIVWQQRTTRENRKVFSNNHEYILVYARDAREFKRSRNLLPPTEALLARYRNPDGDPRGPWQSVSANAQAGHATASQFYEVVAPNGKHHSPPEGRCWVYAEDKMRAEIEAGNIWFGKTGNGVPRIKRFLRDKTIGLTPETLWPAADVGTNDNAKKHILRLLPDERVFDTPKPEALISRILHIASDPGDLVLDPYLGSGTTLAVAQKMGRRSIGIEQGDHAVTHCVQRLRLVADGEQGGISKDVNWTGGGGLCFFEGRPRPSPGRSPENQPNK